MTPPSSASPGHFYGGVLSPLYFVLVFLSCSVWIQISPPFLSYPTLLFLVVVVSGGGAMGGFVLCNTPFLVEVFVCPDR